MKPKAIAHRVEELPDAHLGLGVSSSDQAHMSAAFFWAKMILHARRTGRAGSWRSAERRVGNECVRTCSSRWSPHHQKNEVYANMVTVRVDPRGAYIIHMKKKRTS